MGSKLSLPALHPDLIWASAMKNDRVRLSGWVAPGETVTIKGLDISCGMFYVGSMIYTPDGRRVTNEPSIINPAKPAKPTGAEEPPYWYGSATSYQSMDAGERWRYLSWLAAGRPLPTKPTFVSLFLCGLERRALVDARHLPPARAELPLIEAEVRRLLGQPNAYMFGYQAKEFLLALRLVKGDLEHADPPPPEPVESWEVPLELKIGLAGFAVRGQPLPGKWALAWLRSDPNIRLSTPARRCPKEFNELFLKRYVAEHGDGIMLRNNKTRIRYHYSPVNRSLWGDVTLDAPNLPDVTRQRKATWAISMVALATSQQLDPYSRWVSMHHDRTSLRAIALLPAEIGGRRKAFKEFQQWADRKLNGASMVELPVTEFVELWSRSSTGNMTRREVELLSEFLERFQFGIEPDIRHGGVDPSRADTLVFFRLPEPAEPGSRTGQAHARALLLLRLSLVVALNDGQASPAQTQLLERTLERMPGLTANERARLNARFRWSLNRPVDTKGLKQQSAAFLSEDERRQTARFLVTLAGVESRIGPHELKTLEKVYKLLGLKHQEVARDVHAMATAMSEPVTIIPAGDERGYTLPAERPEPPKQRVRLSSERVASIEAETRLVGAVLGDVFAAAETIEPEPAVETEHASPAVALNLDDAHLALARRLAERDSWSRAEVEALCGQFGLLAAGAIETLNEAAFDLADEPFLEGADPLDVNTEIVAEFLHA